MHDVLKVKYSREFTLFSLVFVVIYLGVALFLWPGLIRPDSLTQLNQAISGVMTDHHPPIMGLYWRLLHYIYPGSGPLFLTHLSLLFGGLYLFAMSVRNSHWIWFYLGLVFWPQIAFYAPFIVKDISFTFSFLFVAGALTYYSVSKAQLSYLLVLFLSVILFYGTGVKYQAMFILPFMCVWMSFLMKGMSGSVAKFIRGIILFGIIYAAAQLVNSAYTTKQDHAWQYVKLFDLAGMSIETNTDMIPDVAKVDLKLSLDELKQLFNPERVDEMVFPMPVNNETPILKKGNDEEERNLIWDKWFQAVKENPIAYLKHRWQLLKFSLTKSPIKGLADAKSSPEAPQKVIDLLKILEDTGILGILKAVSSFIFWLPIMFIYMASGFWLFSRSRYAPPLLMLNVTGFALIAVLFVFSMASDVRYIYLTMCFFHVSHPFFFLSLRDWWKNRY